MSLLWLYMPPLGSVSSLFLLYYYDSKNHDALMVKKTNERIFGCIKAKERGLDASISFIPATSYLNSNRIYHLSLNFRQCGIDHFE